ncbi:MAG: non-heme iron oxygenase ferredoxin subunit [Anaerolineae bacterium]|jgi:3-phenylpropionate/trans-cinnamate dioxygenase ferredoxin subunit|nr:non-heme iron oxygenase ferredoxin subunit [Anaerolineae bacterium]
MADYVTVAQVDELPAGERLVVEINRKWVAVFNVGGEFYAVQDICSHDEGELAEGELHGCEIACPRHGARFDIRTGKVLSAPAFVDIPAFDVRVVDGLVQVATRKR